MQLTTDLIIQDAIEHGRGTPTLPMPVQVAIADLTNAAQCVSFCWHGLRQMKSASATFNGFEVNVKSLAGRTMVTFIRGGEWVSYLGATEGYCAGLHGCQIEQDSSKEFADWLESFANVFTAEMFLIDESLAVSSGASP